jgi:hypothetical protein
VCEKKKKKTQLHWKLYQFKFKLNAHKPSHKKASKLTSKKSKQEMTRNLPSWIVKIPTIYMTSRAQCKGTIDN